MQRLGLEKVVAPASLFASAGTADSTGIFGKLAEKSIGKDTQTGHWEMMGVVSTQAFPTYPHGFPPEIINAFIEQTGCGQILCNKPASGTTILAELGEVHQTTTYPIVYTSADSVFQIAVHTDVVPLETLYEWCRIARRILQGQHRVGRVIARPFTGEKGHYRRLSGDRRDYAVPPPKETFLDAVVNAGGSVLGIGKIEDIFAGQGLTYSLHTGCNCEGLELTAQAIAGKLDLSRIRLRDAHERSASSASASVSAHAVSLDTAAAPESTTDPPALIFTNLVDTDSLYGHRRDVKGYAAALEEIDGWLEKIMALMYPNDLLIISSDHGNDPTAPGTDHTREYVPLLIYSPCLENAMKESASNHSDYLLIREGFDDIAATLSQWLTVPWNGGGVSCIPPLLIAANNQ